MNEAATLIQEEAHEDANIIFGSVIDETMGDEVRITVIATGFGGLDRVREPIRPVERETERPDAVGRAWCESFPRREGGASCDSA